MITDSCMACTLASSGQAVGGAASAVPGHFGEIAADSSSTAATRCCLSRAIPDCAATAPRASPFPLKLAPALPRFALAACRPRSLPEPLGILVRYTSSVNDAGTFCDSSSIPAMDLFETGLGFPIILIDRSPGVSIIMPPHGRWTSSGLSLGLPALWLVAARRPGSHARPHPPARWTERGLSGA